ncbi:unnamed protein product [Protopolystoma xenopodis]|uniref:Uncharacterized protein n=1 Tax=Protopolystoma xenopodis TaxID=117903 RepID=A0A448WF89_9PLAT|nr:unnamed protein product [Protopolystoma xenopodis]
MHTDSLKPLVYGRGLAAGLIGVFNEFEIDLRPCQLWPLASVRPETSGDCLGLSVSMTGPRGVRVPILSRLAFWPKSDRTKLKQTGPQEAPADVGSVGGESKVVIRRNPSASRESTKAVATFEAVDMIQLGVGSPDRVFCTYFPQEQGRFLFFSV